MIIAISITLYFLSGVYAFSTGVELQRNNYDAAKAGLLLFVIMFVLAAAMQVFP